MRVVGFDIETTHLKGNMGHILCAVAQPVGGKMKLWRIDKTPGFGKTPQSYVNDKAMVADMVDYLGRGGCRHHPLRDVLRPPVRQHTGAVLGFKAAAPDRPHRPVEDRPEGAGPDEQPAGHHQ